MKQSAPRTPQSGDRPEAARREQIIEAAQKVLTAMGFENTTTRRIAEAAGVNSATLHYHFGTKEALLKETVREVYRRANSEIADRVASATNPPEALKSAFEATAEMVKRQPVILRYDLAVRGVRDPEAREEALTIYGTFQKLVTEIAERHLATGGRFANGLTPERFAQFMVATADGVILQYTIYTDETAFTSSMNLLLQYALTLMEVAPE